MSMDPATKNLEALAGWQQRLETHLDQADTTGVKDPAALGKVLAELDAVEAPVLLKQQTLGAALLRFPNAIDTIAKLRSRDSGRPLDGTTLLRHVETGLGAGIETILSRDADTANADGTQHEHAADIRGSVDAARMKIAEEHALRELGRTLDQASVATLQTRKAEVQALNDSPIGDTIAAYLALHTDKASWLGNAEIGALPLGDTGLFFSREGIVSSGAKEWTYRVTGAPLQHAFRPIFVRLRPHHLGGVPTAEVKRAMEALVEAIAGDTVPELDTRSFFRLKHGATSASRLHELQGENVKPSASTAKTHSTWPGVVEARLAILTETDPALVASLFEQLKAGDFDALDALSDRLRELPEPTLKDPGTDESAPRTGTNGWSIRDAVRPILDAIKAREPVADVEAPSIEAKVQAFAEIADSRRGDWTDVITELQGGLPQHKPRTEGDTVGLRASSQHGLYVTSEGLCTTKFDDKWVYTFHPADDRLLASIDPLDFAVTAELNRRDFLANGRFGYQQTAEHRFVPSAVE